MVQKFFKTDKGIVVKDNDSIRIKSSYTKQCLTETEFNDSNPVKIKKHRYLEELNKFFNNSKYEWEHDGVTFRKLDNFDDNFNPMKDIPYHTDIMNNVIGSAFIVMYHGRLYYTFMSGNYYPQMQLIDFHTKSLTGKWTNIRNLAPVFNTKTKKII